MIDEKDRMIIELLSKNARMSYSEIARRLGMSDVAVIKRIKKLEQMGVIRGYTVLVDPRKMGYNAVSITGITLNPDKMFKALSELKKNPAVKFLAITSGDHPAIALIWARDEEELARIHEAILQIDGVERVWPAIILDVIKNEASLCGSPGF